MKVVHLSDDALLAQVHATCSHGNRLLARLLVDLGEIEERRLHLKAACSSMFDFCVRKLDMSEGAAVRRIAAARLVRRFPTLLPRIERGDIHLSSLHLLREHFTAENLSELVDSASRKSKREVEELVARRAPRPDVPSRIRKLPTAPSRPPNLPVPATTPRTPTTEPSTRESRTDVPPLATVAQPPAPPAPQRPAPARIEPLSEARYKVQLTASAELRSKLERARDLMRHGNPTGDLAVVVERALDALLVNLERDRLGRTSPTAAVRKPRPAKPERVTQATRRSVFERDGERCTFVGDGDERCPSRTFLELDHIEPRARGGAGDASNLRVRCRAHNRLHAEDLFGRAQVERAIHIRQRRSPALDGATAAPAVDDRDLAKSLDRPPAPERV